MVFWVVHTTFQVTILFENVILYSIYLLFLCVYFPDTPRVSIDPSDSPHTVTVGTRVLLYCIAEGRPIPTIKWYKNNTAIPQQLGPLYPVPTDSPHTTKYTCEGTNYAGNMKNTASASVIVVVESEIQSEMMFLC